MDKKQNQNIEIAATPIQSQPEDAFEQINKYGTYEIQPTADSDNKYPEIAQGCPKGRKSGDEFTGIVPENATHKFKDPQKGTKSAKDKT